MNVTFPPNVAHLQKIKNWQSNQKIPFLLEAKDMASPGKA
jgi:hypothetical protein